MSLLNLKNILLEKFTVIRQNITTNPKIINWRLWLFNYSPFLSNHFFKILALIGITIVFYSGLYFIKLSPTSPFPTHTLVTIERGQGLNKIAEIFEQNKIIKSAFWLKVFIVLLGGEKKVVAGDYYFPEPVNIFGVSKILHEGRFGLIPQRVTLQEGLSSIEIANILEKNLPAFKKEDFLAQINEQKLEGFLFPDTYFFMTNAKSNDVILTMRETFAREFQKYQDDFIKSGKTLEEIVILASIIEGEALTLESKRIVSGILYNRLNKKMPLQVDAPFKYYNGKNSYTLTKDNLKEDHPYNTYINKGLPPTAINNPGIDSIRAAIAPTNTNYFFFLSDKKGNMYYARNFEGHQQNRELYLR